MEERSKPKKPSPDFPLTPHNRGAWCKSIGGKLKYFGRWEDPEGALKEYQQYLKDPFHVYSKAMPTVADMVNGFLRSKKAMIAKGELSQRTWDEYHSAAARITKAFGRTRPLETLSPEDFTQLRTSFPDTWGSVRTGNEIQRIRVILRYAGPDGAALLRHPIPVGPNFHRPKKKATRRLSAGGPSKLFSKQEVVTAINESRGQLRTMILLGINAGLGNTDCGLLRWSHIDLDHRWLDYPRPKTGIRREAKLWEETVEALKENGCPGEYVFRTKYGGLWEDPSKSGSAISAEFRKLLRRLKIYRPGATFYSLRHTFQTWADDCKDPVAVMRVMGHHDPSMSGVYREHVGLERLSQVSEHVRRKLGDLHPPEKATPPSPKSKNQSSAYGRE